ncbi:MAG: ATP-binding protein [Ignavibacteriota bacterium]
MLASLGQGEDCEYGILIRRCDRTAQVERGDRQAQKLESIGVLAGGIAHDFNNLLTGIMGGVSFAKSSLAPDHPAYSVLEVAEHSSERAAELTTQLLAYAGKGKFVITRFDFSKLVADMLPLIEASIPKAVQLQLVLTPDLPWIEGDASQIRQVVMNLIINGAESIAESGGTVRVSTGIRAVAGDAGNGESGTGKPRREAYLEVKDSGSGITEANKAKMFDPFFTTKFAGRGLGLAAVAGILRGHKGRMDVESIPGEGHHVHRLFPGSGANGLRVC